MFFTPEKPDTASEEVMTFPLPAIPPKGKAMTQDDAKRIIGKRRPKRFMEVS
jgi:hypothetical protein